MSSMVIFIVLINILVFNGEVVDPGCYSGYEYAFALLACVSVGVMHHYARDHEIYTYTANLWVADCAALLFCLILMWLGFDLLLHPAKHELFLQKIGSAVYVPHLVFIGAIVGFTGVNIFALYAKFNNQAEAYSENKA